MTSPLDHVQRMPPALGLGDPGIPAAQIEVLRELAEDIRRHRRASGAGFTVLFAGESGTGKTLAASALAHELGSVLYRVDLAAVISKPIGETEKNLRQLFDAAEEGGALLLLDEADALFGKRSANIEVNDLLDHAERARAVSIVGVAFPSSFLHSELRRRLRACVDFPETAPE